MLETLPKIESFGATDIGLVRSNNEDTWHRTPEYGFFALADGMGGHKAGEVASHQAIQFLSYSIEELLLIQEEEWDVEDMEGFLRVLYENTNAWVHNLSLKKHAYKGMGTTLCSLLFFKGKAIIVSVGDSRIYRFKEGTLQQITEDHTLETTLLAEGQPHEIATKSKNILTMAIGTSLEVHPEITVVSPLPGDVYLLCSDGLSDYVPHTKIENIVGQNCSLQTTAHALIEAAKEHGSSDNITTVLVRIQDEKRDEENIP